MERTTRRALQKEVKLNEEDLQWEEAKYQLSIYQREDFQLSMIQEGAQFNMDRKWRVGNNKDNVANINIHYRIRLWRRIY